MIYAACLIWAGNDNNNSGNFICVFECTIVNPATYRQFTKLMLPEIGWLKKTKQNKSRKKRREKKSK